MTSHCLLRGSCAGRPSRATTLGNYLFTVTTMTEMALRNSGNTIGC